MQLNSLQPELNALLIYPLDPRGLPGITGGLTYELENGDGSLPGDCAEAWMIYLAAVVDQDPMAMNNLACLYYRGTGTLYNPQRAEKYMREAARLGCTAAMVNLGNLAERESDYGEAWEWYEEAAGMGDVLGRIYAIRMQLLGLTEEQNPEIAEAARSCLDAAMRIGGSGAPLTESDCIRTLARLSSLWKELPYGNPVAEPLPVEEPKEERQDNAWDPDNQDLEEAIHTYTLAPGTATRRAFYRALLARLLVNGRVYVHYSASDIENGTRAMRPMTVMDADGLQLMAVYTSRIEADRAVTQEYPDAAPIQGTMGIRRLMTRFASEWDEDELIINLRGNACHLSRELILRCLEACGAMAESAGERNGSATKYYEHELHTARETEVDIPIWMIGGLCRFLTAHKVPFRMWNKWENSNRPSWETPRLADMRKAMGTPEVVTVRADLNEEELIDLAQETAFLSAEQIQNSRITPHRWPDATDKRGYRETLPREWSYKGVTPMEGKRLVVGYVQRYPGFSLVNEGDGVYIIRDGDGRWQYKPVREARNQYEEEFLDYLQESDIRRFRESSKRKGAFLLEESRQDVEEEFFHVTLESPDDMACEDPDERKSWREEGYDFHIYDHEERDQDLKEYNRELTLEQQTQFALGIQAVYARDFDEGMGGRLRPGYTQKDLNRCIGDHLEIYDNVYDIIHDVQDAREAMEELAADETIPLDYYRMKKIKKRIEWIHDLHCRTTDAIYWLGKAEGIETPAWPGWPDAPLFPSWIKGPDMSKDPDLVADQELEREANEYGEWLEEFNNAASDTGSSEGDDDAADEDSAESE